MSCSEMTICLPVKGHLFPKRPKDITDFLTCAAITNVVMHEQIFIHASNFYIAYPVQGHRGLSNHAFHERHGKPWTGHQSITRQTHTVRQTEKISRKSRTCKLHTETPQMATMSKYVHVYWHVCTMSISVCIYSIFKLSSSEPLCCFK